MKDSVKANLIVFSIIAIISFSISSSFANLTIHEDNDSYKMIAIENDSFEPSYIEEVPTIIPEKPTNNTTNTTNANTTELIEDYLNSTGQYIENTIEKWNETYTDWTTDNETYKNN